jgi:hypothetical protein
MRWFAGIVGQLSEGQIHAAFIAARASEFVAHNGPEGGWRTEFYHLNLLLESVGFKMGERRKACQPRTRAGAGKGPSEPARVLLC